MKANNPTVFAEEVIDSLNCVPWPLCVLLRYRSNVNSFRVHTFKPNDPECARLAATPGYYEVGTYTAKGVRKVELVQDFLDVMAKAR